MEGNIKLSVDTYFIVSAVNVYSLRSATIVSY